MRSQYPIRCVGVIQGAGVTWGCMGNARRGAIKRGSKVRTLLTWTVQAAHGEVFSTVKFTVGVFFSRSWAGQATEDLTFGLVLSFHSAVQALFIFFLRLSFQSLVTGSLGEMQKTNKKRRAWRTRANLTKAAHQWVTGCGKRGVQGKRSQFSLGKMEFWHLETIRSGGIF